MWVNEDGTFNAIIQALELGYGSVTGGKGGTL